MWLSIDRDKVVKGLTICRHEAISQENCMECPYIYDKRSKQSSCECVLHDDALKLLKEQEAVSAHWDDDTCHWIEGDRDGIDPHTRTTGEGIDTFRCSWCGYYLYWKTPFCPNCGAKMEGAGEVE